MKSVVIKSVMSALSLLMISSLVIERASAASPSETIHYSGTGSYSAKESSVAIAAILFSAIPMYRDQGSKPNASVDVAVNKKQSLMTVTLTPPTGPRVLKCDLFTATSEVTTRYEEKQAPSKYQTTVLRGVCEDSTRHGVPYEVLVRSGQGTFHVIVNEADVETSSDNVTIVHGDAELKAN